MCCQLTVLSCQLHLNSLALIITQIYTNRRPIFPYNFIKTRTKIWRIFFPLNIFIMWREVSFNTRTYSIPILIQNFKFKCWSLVGWSWFFQHDCIFHQQNNIRRRIHIIFIRNTLCLASLQPVTQSHRCQLSIRNSLKFSSCSWVILTFFPIHSMTAIWIICTKINNIRYLITRCRKTSRYITCLAENFFIIQIHVINTMIIWTETNCTIQCYICTFLFYSINITNTSNAHIPQAFFYLFYASRSSCCFYCCPVLIACFSILKFILIRCTNPRCCKSATLRLHI